MRVIRSFLMMLAVASAAAGCAGPLADSADGPAPANMQAAAPKIPASGIDAMAYGSAGQALPRQAPAPSMAPRGLYADAVAPSVAMPPTPAAEPRGLFAATDAAPAPVAEHTASAPPAVPVAAARADASVPPGLMAYAPAAEHKPYTLDSGDRLRIVVFGQDGLSNAYVVDASGYIAMPLIGTVLARGATTEELSSRISEKLRDGYVKEPHVAVEVEAYRPFFILGEVTQPGQYPYVADMTVETAVAIAGGFGPRAYRQTVTVMRTMHGQRMRMSVPTSFALRPGDTVNVQERWF